MERIIWRLFGWQTLAGSWFDPRPARRVRCNLRRGQTTLWVGRGS